MLDPSPEEFNDIQELRRRLQEAEAALSQLGDHSLLNARLTLESEQNFRFLAENAIEAIFIGSPEGTFLYANPQAGNLTGYSPQELIGMHISHIIAEEDLETVTERAKARLEGLPVPSRYEILIRHRSGKYVPVEIAAAPTIWKNQPALMAFVHDISNRRQMEEALAWELRVNLALAELGHHLLSSISMEQMSIQVLEQAKLLTNSPYGFVGYLNQDGQLIADTLSGGIWEECALADKSKVVTHSTGLWDWVIKHGQPAWSNDHASDQRASLIPPEHISIYRFAAAPAKQNDRVIGVVAVANSAEPYSIKQVNFLERLGDVYAAALQRWNADKTIEKASSRAHSLVEITEHILSAGLNTSNLLQIVAQKTSDLLHATCVIYYASKTGTFKKHTVVIDPDPDVQELIEATLVKFPEIESNLLIRQVIDNGKGVRLSKINSNDLYGCLTVPYLDVAKQIGFHSLVLEPLRTIEGTVGVIAAARHKERMSFDEWDFTFLQEIANRTAMALSNARLYEEIQFQQAILEQRIIERTADIQNERDFAHLIMNTVAQGISVVDENRRFTYVNPAFARLLGYTTEELIGKRPEDITLPQDKTILDNNWERRLRGEVTSYENILIHRDGTHIPAMITGVPRIKDGKVIGTIATITDLREQKRFQERQKWLQDFRDILLSTAQVFIEVTHENMDEVLSHVLAEIGRFLQVDRVYIFQFDWEKDTMTNTFEWCAEGISPQKENLQEIPNNNLPEWVTALQTQPNILIPLVSELPDSWSAVKEALEAQEIKSLLAMPIKGYEQLLGFVGYDAVRAERRWDEDEIRMLGILANHLARLFEREQIAKALKESETRYRLLAENISDVILTFDLDFNIRYISPSVQLLTGFTPQEVIQKHFHELLTPSSYQILRRFVAQELSSERLENLSLDKPSTSTIDLEIVHKDSSTRWIEAKTNFLFDQQGKPLEMICSVRDISERRQASQILEYMATHDPLTGLPNRALFQDRLEHAIKRAIRKNSQIGVLLIDLDHFKRINDTLGHLKGDQVLKEVSRRLLTCLRESDTVARMGGDEFTVILEEIYHPKEIKIVVQKLMDNINLPYELEEGAWKITSSIGISLFPNDGKDMESLLRCADIAMYRAKRRRNRYIFYSKPS